MTLIFNEEFAINPQSAQSGGGGGTKNNVDWSKIGLSKSYNEVSRSDYNYMSNGSIWVRDDGAFYPRASKTETYTTKFVNFSQPFEINVQFTSPTETDRNSVIFGNGYGNQYFRCPACEYQAANADITFWFGLSTTGTTWDYGVVFSPSEVPKLPAGETYVVSSKYDGTNWIVTVKWGENNVATKSVAITGTPYYSSNSGSDGSYLQIGQNASNTSTTAHGIFFYLGNTFVKQNDVLVWGCEAGQNYIEVDPNNYLISNVTKVGAVEDDKGIISGFYPSNVYAYTNPVTLTEGSEINISFIVPVTMSADAPIISGYNSNDVGDVFIASGGGNLLSIWDGNSAFFGTTPMIGNKKYSFKLVKNSSNLLDMYLKEGLPTSNISDYTLEFSNATDIISGNQIRFGVYNNQSYQNGSIDLNNCYIKIDGQTAWQGVVPQGTRV